MELHNLLINDKEIVSLDDVFLNQYNQKSIQQLIKENKYVAELTQYGLPVNNKILLQGNSGCGKTTTAKAKISNKYSIKQQETTPYCF